MGKSKKYANLEECEYQNAILKVICRCLVITVIGMFMILLAGILSVVALHNEEKVVDKYASWAKELQEKEEFLEEYISQLEQEGIEVPEWQESGRMEEEEEADEENIYIDDTVYENDVYEWMVKLDETIEITGYYDCGQEKISIPKKLDGKSVTSIAAEVFCDCSELVGITIPDSITRIGEGAFSGCNNLTNVDLSKNVTKIEDGLFANCESLAKISLPDSVTCIGAEAFSNCYALSSVELPKKLEVIEEYAFSGCESLKKIALPSKLEAIQSGAFADCVSLAKIEIPENIVSLESEVFYNCYCMTEIKIPKTVQHIDDTAFAGCDELTIKAPSGSVAAIYAEENGYGLKKD